MGALRGICCLVVLPWLLAACGDTAPTGNQGNGPAAPSLLKLGTLSYKPLETRTAFRPLTDYLSRDPALLCEPVAAVDVTDAERMLREGELDVVIDSPVIVYHLARTVPLQVRLRRSKGGVDAYHGVIFARRDSNLNSVEELVGRMVAFEDPWSTSGYFLPASLIARRGLQLRVKETPDVVVGIGEVGAVFALDEETIVLWVLAGRCAAGATSNLDFDAFAGEQAGELSVLARSDPVPRHVVAFRADLPAARVDALCARLCAMDESEEGRRVLAAFEGTTDFAELENEASLRRDISAGLDALKR